MRLETRRRWRGRDLVEGLEERVLLSTASVPAYGLALVPNETALSSPKFSDQWYLQNTGQTLSSNPSGPATGTPGADIGATKAWNLTTGSRNVVVAVFDTGVDLTHPDLVNSIWTNPGEIPGNGIDDDHDGLVDDVHGWNFVDGNNDVSDTSLTDHGTLVSGVIAAEGNNGQGITGTNWHVTILPVKVGTDTGVTSADLQAGISYVEALKARGVNIVAINASYISFGIPSLSDISAIGTTANYGILYVSAAGNSSLNFDSLIPGGFLPSNMLLVAATDNQDQLASFSNYGSNSVALGAPGVDILTTMRGGGYGMFSGTSFAGPMVSGTAALLKAYVPGATLQQIENAILTGSTNDPALAGKTITGKRLSAYGALEALVGNQAPIGHVDVISRTGVSGWAFDYNGGVQPVAVAMLVDGKFVAATLANVARSDLATAFGSSAHAFSFASSTLSSLGAGSHTVQLYAIDQPGLGAALPPALIGSGTIIGPQAPVGRIDTASATTITGWVFDPDTPTEAVQLRINIDGAPGGAPTAGLPRPDVTQLVGSGNHGFSYTWPDSLPVGFHRIDVFAADTTSGALTYIGSREVNSNIAPRGSVDVFNGSTLAGWAFDANDPTASIQIRYQIDSNAPQLATANVTRGDLQTVLGSANHGFALALPQLPAGPHAVSVWAVDPATKSLALLGTKGMVVADPAGNRLPFGHLDIATNGRVAGWAYDPSTPFAPIQVRIDVDGVATIGVVASVRRDDLTPTLHGPSFGFDRALSLAAGPHRLDVYAIDAPGGTAVLLGSRVVGDPAATGTLASVTATTAAGTVTLPGSPSTPAQVLLTINGAAAVLATADSSHNYAITLPKLLPGTYQFAVYGIDPVTLTPTVLGARAVAVG